MKRELAIILCVACGAANPTPDHPRANRGHPELDRFVADEEHVLSLLAAADARIAARGITPDPLTLHHTVMSGVIAEDPTMGMEGDRPDVLSFDIRSRALDAAGAIADKWKVPPEAGPALSRPDLEVELVKRLIASEKLRLVSERDLPRSASALLGALATTWRAPDVKDVQTHDDWLARRIADVTASLKPQSLTMPERDDLDDALDPLEHAMEGMTKSAAALVGLRLAVQRVDVALRPRDRWDAISLRLAADDGMQLSADTLLAFLTTEAKLLKGEIDALVGVKVTDDVATRAAETVLAESETCHTQLAAPSRMRALEPPTERAFECSLRKRMLAAHTANEVLDVLLAMHDAVVAAAWSVVTARGGDAVAVALAAPKLLAPISTTAEGRLSRFAATRPVDAITRALAIEWLMRSGLVAAVPRAEAWRAFGDAPIDIVDREVHPQSKGGTAHQTTQVSGR